MALGQAVFRDQRRRRVLHEEARRGGARVSLPVQPGARYTEAANVENHPQITQFIPRRYRSYAGGLAVAAGAIGAVGGLHVWSQNLAAALESSPVVAFDLAAGGGLAAWFAALMLAALGLVAWIVYSLRKHRVDDYRARYRLWLWVAGGALFASADSVASLHQVWSDFWVSQTAWTALDGSVWWLAPVGLFVAWLGVRLVLETAECRGACTLVVLGLAAYAAAGLAAAGLLPAGLPGAELVVVSCGLLLGHAFALAGATLYARYVVLDVQGLVPRASASGSGDARSASARAGKSAAARAAKKQFSDLDTPATLPLATHAASESTSKSARKPAGREERGAAWVDGSAGRGEHEEDDASTGNRLSKAERKRLRKQQRRCA